MLMQSHAAQFLQWVIKYFYLGLQNGDGDFWYYKEYAETSERKKGYLVDALYDLFIKCGGQDPTK